ncbi:hypothetical protein TNCV_577021 [Trichonephila clavipes]|nr:hypothetical protein TNCV_577021 [Trichonephila clavipes]
MVKVTNSCPVFSSHELYNSTEDSLSRGAYAPRGDHVVAQSLHVDVVGNARPVSSKNSLRLVVLVTILRTKIKPPPVTLYLSEPLITIVLFWIADTGHRKGENNVSCELSLRDFKNLQVKDVNILNLKL